MTKSEVFKASHKLAKAWHKKLGGDYVVYFAKALKGTLAASKNLTDDCLFNAMNKIISKFGGDRFITKSVKSNCTHGLVEVKFEHQLNSYKLEKGQFFGKAFSRDGKVCAWVRSISYVQEAY